MRSKDSINLGLELIKNCIIKKGWELDVVSFGQKINSQEYDIIGFNIFYVTQQLNLVPFLKQNNIEPLRENESNRPLLIAGGQGIQNPKPISDFIDLFIIGDGEENIIKILDKYEKGFLDELIYEEGIYSSSYPKEKIDFGYIKHIDSEPIIHNKRAMIELTRGCKYRCKFCQYGWTNGIYREKNFELVKKQILEVKNQEIKNINLLSCNLGGYSKIEELLKFCIDNKIRLMNSDIRVDEYPKIANLLDELKIRTLKVGVESFNELTRFDCGKKITDQQLNEFFELAINRVNNIHFYLIYGLPTEKKYNTWFEFIKMAKRKYKKLLIKKYD